MNNILINSNNYINNSIASNVAIAQETIHNAASSNPNVNVNVNSNNNNNNNNNNNITTTTISNSNNSTHSNDNINIINNSNNYNNPMPINLNPNFNINPNMIVNPNEIVSIEDQKQYKIQLLLHINSVLLARVIQLTNIANNNNNNNSNNNVPESIQRIISQSLKRVHANLQCISQINQGILRAKPVILDPPEILNNNNNSNSNNPSNNPPQDILMKLYILMGRIFEFW